MHGTRGTTGSDDCLLLYSGVGKSLIFPTPLFLLAKFEAGKPGGESVSALLYSRTLTEFSGRHWGNPVPSAAVRSSCWPPVVSAAAAG